MAQTAVGGAARTNGQLPSIRKFCAGMTPAQRHEFFSVGGDGRSAYPEHVCNEQLDLLKSNHTRAGLPVCSATWHDARWHGAEYPPGGCDDTAMVISRALVRIGDAGQPSHRWLPSQSAKIEDKLDEGDALAVRIACQFPSPSAIAMSRMRFYNRHAIARLRDEGGRVGRKRTLVNGKRKTNT